jgi:hypothetical protein
MKIFILCFFLNFVFRSESAPFQNLDFEQANTNTTSFPGNSPPFVKGSGPVADLLPGWQIYHGTNQSTVIGYVYIQLAPGYGTLITRDTAQFYLSSTGGAIDGDFAPLFIPDDQPFYLLQRGDIPVDAQFLTFNDLGTRFSLGINGILFPNAQSGLDISSFAGQTVDLLFIFPQNGFFPYYGVDSIAFVVPEPLFVESDFNGDGLPDVVFEHQDGFIGVWFMNKGPDLISGSFFNPEAVADPLWHIVGTGNFTETNKTDLLFQHEDGSLAVWSMDGTNLVSGVLLNPSQPGDSWKVVGTGAMNHDGKKDILFQHTDGTLAVWFMDGINLLQGALLNPTKPGDSGWRVVGTANLTSVGNTDLIFQHSDGTLAAWYMDGTNLVRGALLNPSAPGEDGWRVATTLDLNGDGKTDLLFQHDDGTVAVWLMDGINLISGQLLNPADPGSGWRIAGPR